MYNNYFQDGGEDPTGANFFNSLLDMNIQQDEETPQEEQSPNEEQDSEENDFINNLNEYAIETENTDLRDQINELREQIAMRNNDRAMEQEEYSLEEKMALLDFYQTPQGEDALMAQYEPQPVATTSIPDAPKYTPVEGNVKAGYNNIGNIRDIKTGKFRSFATPQEGKNALIHQLNLYRTGKTRTGLKPTSTLYEAMSVYAPAADRNNPKKYAEFIAKKIGLPPTTPIAQIDPDKWADAIRIMEGNKNVDKMAIGGYAVAFKGGRIVTTTQKDKRKYSC